MIKSWLQAICCLSPRSLADKHFNATFIRSIYVIKYFDIQIKTSPFSSSLIVVVVGGISPKKISFACVFIQTLGGARWQEIYVICDHTQELLSTFPWNFFYFCFSEARWSITLSENKNREHSIEAFLIYASYSRSCTISAKISPQAFSLSSRVLITGWTHRWLFIEWFGRTRERERQQNGKLRPY